MRRFDPVRRARRGLAAWGLAAALAVVLAPVVAASTLTYTISGVEYAATSTQAKFAGVAVATVGPLDFGTWKAVVIHTGLIGTGTVEDPLRATINAGGTFSYDGQALDIEGTFSGGTLTQTGGFSGLCPKQTFDVNGTLALTSPAGSGSFSAMLTHYRTMLFGNCRTYAATVKGTFTLL